MAVKQTLTLTEESYDILANTSQVRILWTSKQTSGSHNDYTETAKYYVTANGTTEEYTVKYTLPASTTKTILDTTITVPHAEDGTGSVKVETWMDTGISAGVVKLSKTLELTPIARASTIGATDAYIESTTIVAVNQKSTDYTHSIAFAFGDLGGYIDADGNISETEVKHTAVNIPFVIPASFYEQIPDQPSAVCTLSCTTWQGDTQLGQTQTATFTVTAKPELCLPEITGTVADINPNTLALTGSKDILIRYYSVAKCTAEATAKNGASISAVTINGADGLTGLEIPNVETSTFYFVATDTRGYTTTRIIRKTMIPYIPLTINAVIARTDPTSGNAKLTVKGRYYPGSFGAAENTLALTYTVSGADPVEIPYTLTDSGYEAEIIVSGLDYLSSHNVAVTVWDALAEVEQTVRVNPGIPVFDWGPEDFAFHVPVTVQGTNIREKLQGALDIMVDRSGDIMEGPLDMGGNQLTGLPEPTQDTDAAPKSYVDGKLSMCKVWTNESPEENFAAQEVALELKNASGVSIRYKNQANGTACKTTGFVPMGGAVMLQYVPADGVPKRRECTVSETGVTFETGYDGDTSGTKNCIPLEIYAWYGTTSSVTGDNTGGSGETGDTETDDDSETVTVGTTQSNSVKKYGAVGDGITDDTAAFTEALASERVVYVPGGTYLLSDALVIGENCCLELSQDTVLQFTLTSGNCITLEMSASLRGNHATINVPYAFTGYVINADSTTTTSQSETPPWSKWDPQWKSGRYVTDLNICKPDSRGFHYSVDGGCNGTAVYISADGSATQSFVWGLHFSGLRIAGAFSYGIRAVNFNDGWAHEMRVDAFIDACEIGVSLESCNNAYISAIVQPRRAYTTAEVYIPYAKHGIQLINSKNVDLSGSRVWDWNAEYTMWTDGGEYQHLALVGQCRGLILNDFLYYEQSTIDIRDLIYTDTPSNLEQMTILQEPFTRWFKPIDNEPYFFNGDTDKRLVLKDEFDECFDTDRVLGFTDMLSTAIDEAGAVYNEIGYKEGVRIVQSTGAESSTSSDSYYVSTGFIPCKAGDVLYVKGASFDQADGWTGIAMYNASFNRVWGASYVNIMSGSMYYQGGERTEDGLKITLKSTLSEQGTVAYVRLTFHIYDFSSDPFISVNEEIKYTNYGFLADGIKVKGDAVLLTSPSGKTFVLSISDNGVLSAEQVV